MSLIFIKATQLVSSSDGESCRWETEGLRKTTKETQTDFGICQRCRQATAVRGSGGARRHLRLVLDGVSQGAGLGQGAFSTGAKRIYAGSVIIIDDWR